MIKLSKADTGASRICRDIAGYALGAYTIVGVCVVLGTLAAYENRPVRPVAALEVHADSGYARNVDHIAAACQRAIQEVADSMGADAAKVTPDDWRIVYWDCLVKFGATL